MNNPTAHQTQTLMASRDSLSLCACTSSPHGSSVWLDGYFGCQIKKEKAHKIHKCTVTCVGFVQPHLESDLNVGTGVSVFDGLRLRPAQISSAQNRPQSMYRAKGLDSLQMKTMHPNIHLRALCLPFHRHAYSAGRRRCY